MAAARTYTASGVRNQPRSLDEFAALAFTGLDLVDPGVVLVSEWRPSRAGPRPLPSEVNWNGGRWREP